jgi:hypothetical protein
MNVAVRPAVLWSDEPELAKATVGLTIDTLREWSRRGWIPMHTRKGAKTQKKHYWIVDEVVAALKLNSTSSDDVADSDAEEGENNAWKKTPTFRPTPKRAARRQSSARP